MRNLKLMADYECFPLWETDENGLKNINPNELSISEELKRDLLAWADKYDSTLDWDYPPDSGFKYKQEKLESEATGENLYERLKGELDEQFDVSLFQITKG